MNEHPLIWHPQQLPAIAECAQRTTGDMEPTVFTDPERLLAVLKTAYPIEGALPSQVKASITDEPHLIAFSKGNEFRCDVQQLRGYDGNIFFGGHVYAKDPSGQIQNRPLMCYSANVSATHPATVSFSELPAAA